MYLCCFLPPGVHLQGIFRLSGSVVQTRLLRLRWDSGEAVDLQQESDVHVVSSLLKLFFRELPTPLVPEANHRQLLSGITGTKRSRGRRKVKPQHFLDIGSGEAEMETEQ